MASADAINRAASIGIAGLDAEAAGKFTEAFDLYQNCSQQLLTLAKRTYFAFLQAHVY